MNRANAASGRRRAAYSAASAAGGAEQSHAGSDNGCRAASAARRVVSVRANTSRAVCKIEYVSGRDVDDAARPAATRATVCIG
jgi:hypothetical protein